MFIFKISQCYAAFYSLFPFCFFSPFLLSFGLNIFYHSINLPTSLKLIHLFSIVLVLILEVIHAFLTYKRLMLMGSFILLPDNSRTTEHFHLPQSPTYMLLLSYILILYTFQTLQDLRIFKYIFYYIYIFLILSYIFYYILIYYIFNILILIILLIYNIF